jgi:hypothetical protein
MRALDRSRRGISTPEGILALRGLLRQNPQITSLNLGQNNIKSREAILALCELLRQNPQITSLNLSYNSIGTLESIAAYADGLLGMTNLMRSAIERPEERGALVVTNLARLNLRRDNTNAPDAILALCELLRQNPQITSLDLSGTALVIPNAIEALVGALQGTKITSLNLAQTLIQTPEAMLALGAALRVTNVTSLDLSRNFIEGPAAIAALGVALQGTNVTSLNLQANRIDSPEKIAALRGLLRQNPQITSLDLSHTGLPGRELLLLVREFRHLHHVVINGERPEIAEQLRFNRDLHAKPAVASLLKLKPKLHSDALSKILECEGVTAGLNPKLAHELIEEAAAPAFNFQQGNFPNAISIAPAEGGRPKISITFESSDGLRAFTANNENTFRELGGLGAAVSYSGTGNGVEIIAPDAKVDTPLRRKLDEIRDKLIPLKIKLDKRRNAAPSASAAAAVMHSPESETKEGARTAAAHGRDPKPAGPHTRRLAEIEMHDPELNDVKGADGRNQTGVGAHAARVAASSFCCRIC